MIYEYEVCDCGRFLIQYVYHMIRAYRIIRSYHMICILIRMIRILTKPHHFLSDTIVFYYESVYYIIYIIIYIYYIYIIYFTRESIFFNFTFHHHRLNVHQKCKLMQLLHHPQLYQLDFSHHYLSQ